MNIKFSRLKASLSFFGSISDSSYRPVANRDNIILKDIKRAKTPKSSGEYKRVSIGETIIGKSCAIVVPLTSTRLLRLNSEEINFFHSFFIIRGFSALHLKIFVQVFHKYDFQ